MKKKLFQIKVVNINNIIFYTIIGKLITLLASYKIGIILE
jgi:hypothetical protein